MEKRRNDLMLAAMASIMGTAAGSILAALYPEWTIWQDPLFRQGFGIETIPFHSLLGFSCIAIGAAALAGLSVCGIPGVLLAIFCKATALGAVLVLYYREGGFAGLLTSLLFVLPFGFGSLLVLLLAAKEACAGARWLTRAVLRAAAGEYPLKRYAVTFWGLSMIQFGLTAAQYGALRCYPVFLSFMIH